ncbi:uncharacterized protein TNIN_253811 [Trichonephila inaurata madagascariensis]|uniref:Uncharacterized protein n=1 Tax=Trichonephila inaurata madagascariensis TaxID=2747483 RepID=A0A8X6JKQ5_9ARAC|nr:uncharacterized protein TNIN_253811 [Trichonephila inaurata madagascariensis]
MDIKALKAQLRVLRTAFNVTLKKLQSEIQGDAIDLKNISLLQTHLKDKYLRLGTVQESVSGVLLQKDDDGTEYEADFSEAEKYREDYLSFSTLVDKKLEESVIVEEQEIPRKFRTLCPEEPEQTLQRLYDELEGKLRALESLRKTQEKFGDFLAPLVESCLPEEILLTWERTRNHQEHSENVTEKNSRTLTNLMTFLRQEVQGEEMVVLARSGFTMHHGNATCALTDCHILHHGVAA